MSCKKENAAIITPILAAGSATTPYYYQVNINQRLCTPVCVDSTPIFNPTFTFVSAVSSAANQYVVTINVEGVITYTPCGGGQCCARVQTVSQEFTIPVFSETAITTVTITKTFTNNSISTAACANCSRDFVSENGLSIAIA